MGIIHMRKLLFLFIMMSSSLTECFMNVPKKINYKMMDSKKENTDIYPIDIVDKNTPEFFYFSINKESFKTAERKHSQIAILALISLVSSEFFLGDYLHNGKGINLLT